MKRFVLLFSLYVVVVLSGKAQITVTSADVAKLYEAGKYQIHYSADSINVNVGIPSASAQAFNFSFTPTQTITFTNYALPHAGEPFTQFQNATHATGFSIPLTISPETTFTSTIYEFLKITNDSLLSVGSAIRQQWSPAAPPLPADTIYYENSSELLIPLPIVYGASRTTVDTVNDMLGGQGFTVTISKETVDGFGTLTIPQGSFPVLRITSLDIEKSYSPQSLDPISIDSMYSVSFISNQGVRFEVQIANGHPTSGETFAERVGTVVTSASPTAVKTERSMTVNEFQLDQNFPNPFNPTTTVTFSIPQSGLTAVKVYDLLGKEVATLINGNLSAGFYTVPFNASELPSGVYFYTLRSGNFTQTKKMILTK